MSRLDPFLEQMARNVGNNGPVPVMLMNAPSLTDPFTTLLYAGFLRGELWLEFFGYTAEWNTLAASAVNALPATQPTIDQGTCFLLLSINLTSYTAAGTIAATPDYTLQITERAGGNNFSDAAIHVANWTGQNRNVGSTPYTLPFPRLLRGNNTIQLQLTNRTATAARVDIALLGIRCMFLKNSSLQTLFGIQG